MFDPKKLQQVADDLGEPRKQIVLEALELLNFCMGSTAELNQANEELDAAVEELENVKRARDNIVTSLRKRTAERDELAATVERLRENWQSLGGCSSHNCCMKSPDGMGSNGGCRCYENRSMMRMVTQRINAVFQQTPHHTINAVKRHVSKDAFIAGATEALCNGSSLLVIASHHAEHYANTKYPSGKDGE